MSNYIGTKKINGTISRTYVDNYNVDGSPRGVFESVEALNLAYPTGSPSVYLVGTDWYYWNESTWIDGGLYQAQGIDNNSVTPLKIKGHDVINIFNCNDANLKTNKNQYIYNNKLYNNDLSGYTSSDYIKCGENINLYVVNKSHTGYPSIICFDINKTPLKWFTSSILYGNLGAITTPTNTAYLTIMTGTSKLNTTAIYVDCTEEPSEFIPYDLRTNIDWLKIKYSNLADDITSKMLGDKNVFEENIANENVTPLKIKGHNPINIFDCNATNLKSNKSQYVYNNKLVNGIENGYTCTDYIECGENINLYVVNSGSASYPSIICFDSNKIPLKAFTVSVNFASLGAITTPLNTAYITFMTTTNKIENKAIYLGCTEQPIDFIPYNYKKFSLDWLDVKEENLDTNLKTKLSIYDHIITIKKDGSGDYDNLRGALESTNTLDTYLIQVHEGTYDVLSDYSADEINSAVYDRINIKTSFCGLYVDGNITIEGIGDREKIILKGELDPNIYSEYRRGQISTLNVQGNITLKNLTITSKAIRYVVHDDFSQCINKTTNIINCKLINYLHYDLTKPGTAWGMGTDSGKITNFENCYFSPNFYQHTRPSEYAPSITTLKNCVCSEKISLQDMGSSQNDKVYIYGCVSPYIKYSWYNNTLANPYLEIVCNSKIPFFYDNTCKALTDDMKIIRNSTNAIISKGSLIKRNGIGDYDLLGTDSNLFYGIALENIAIGEYGKVQNSNYIKASDFGLSASVGDKFKIVNAQLILTTDNNYIGICDVADYVKII